MDEAVWNHAVFSKNRERLLNEAVARQFFGEVLKQAQGHLSKEHFIDSLDCDMAVRTTCAIVDVDPHGFRPHRSPTRLPIAFTNLKANIASRDSLKISSSWSSIQLGKIPICRASRSSMKVSSAGKFILRYFL